MLTIQPVAPAGDGAQTPTSWRADQALDGLMGLLATLLAAGSWATHIVVCATEELWGFLALGVVVFPVAVFHGGAVWLTAWL